MKKKSITESSNCFKCKINLWLYKILARILIFVSNLCKIKPRSLFLLIIKQYSVQKKQTKSQAKNLKKSGGVQSENNKK